MTATEYRAVCRRYRKLLNSARQVVRTAQKYETWLRAQGRVKAWETALRLLNA